MLGEHAHITNNCVIFNKELSDEGLDIILSAALMSGLFKNISTADARTQLRKMWSRLVEEYEQFLQSDEYKEMEKKY